MKTAADYAFKPGCKKLHRMRDEPIRPMLTAYPYQDDDSSIWEVIAGSFVLQTSKLTGEKALWVLATRAVYDRLLPLRQEGLVTALHLVSGDIVIKCEGIAPELLAEFGRKEKAG